MDFQDFRYDYLYETSNSEPPDTQGKDTKKSFQVKNTLSWKNTSRIGIIFDYCGRNYVEDCTLNTPVENRTQITTFGESYSIRWATGAFLDKKRTDP